MTIKDGLVHLAQGRDHIAQGLTEIAQGTVSSTAGLASLAQKGVLAGKVFAAGGAIDAARDVHRLVTGQTKDAVDSVATGLGAAAKGVGALSLFGRAALGPIGGGAASIVDGGKDIINSLRGQESGGLSNTQRGVSGGIKAAAGAALATAGVIGFGAAASPFLLAGGAIGLAGAYTYQNFAGFRNAVDGGLSWLRGSSASKAPAA